MSELEIRGVVKRYAEGAAAVDGVDLTVDPGEIVCLLGPSGCGKTTLLRVIAGLETPDAGSVHFRGVDLATVPVYKRGFGLMFQEFALFPHKTVAENIAFGLRMANKPAAYIAARVDTLLDLINLAGMGDRTVFELSGGERQRIALARSLAPAPQLLMLDEPLGSLDRLLREEILAELHVILARVGVTTLFVTHDQTEAFALADRIVIMHRGRIAQIGAPMEVFRHPASHFVASFLGLNNQIPASIRQDMPEIVNTPLGEFRSAHLTAGLSPGDYILVMRPEGARLARTPLPAALDRGALMPVDDTPDADLVLTGRLVASTFRGSLQHITLDAFSSQGAIQLTFDLPAYQTSFPTGKLAPLVLPQVGQPLQLVIYPSLMSLLPSST